MYIVAFAEDKFRISNIQASYLVSIMALSELAMRIPWGYLSDREEVNRHYLLAFIIANLGISFFSVQFASSFTTLAIICAYSGLFQVIQKFETQIYNFLQFLKIFILKILIFSN